MAFPCLCFVLFSFSLPFLLFLARFLLNFRRFAPVFGLLRPWAKMRFDSEISCRAVDGRTQNAPPGCKRPYVRECKIILTKILFVSFVSSSESNYFLRMGYGGGFSARRRWRFDTSIFRISKVDRPIKQVVSILDNKVVLQANQYTNHLKRVRKV